MFNSDNAYPKMIGTSLDGVLQNPSREGSGADQYAPRETSFNLM